ncbi:tryptase-2-like isoform X2 [Betta splendens]|nr:tryptase-2-like isoform X2 [Betta splendens]
MAFCRLLPLLVLIHNTGDLLGAEVRSGIVGGQDAKRGHWPWMAHLNITADGRTRWRCGGTILGRQWVLTAASCWDRHPKPKETRSMVWVGSHALQEASARYMGILYFISHPQYRNLGNRYLNDIALIKLKKPLTFSDNVKPVSLPAADDAFSPSSDCWIAGWGNVGTNVKLQDPETLQQLKISVVPQAACKRQHPEVTADMLCAGGDDGKGACEGDYGGPLVCRSARGLVQVGIASYGSPQGCGVRGRAGVYTQVSKYLSFIDYIHHGEAPDEA